MAARGVNIVVSGTTRGDAGTVAFIADDEAAARTALKMQRFRTPSERRSPSGWQRPGCGSGGFRKLADAGINVELLLPVRVSTEEFHAVICADIGCHRAGPRRSSRHRMRVRVRREPRGRDRSTGAGAGPGRQVGTEVAAAPRGLSLMTEHTVSVTGHPREPTSTAPTAPGGVRVAAMIPNVDVACRWRGSGGQMREASPHTPPVRLPAPTAAILAWPGGCGPSRLLGALSPLRLAVSRVAEHASASTPCSGCANDATSLVLRRLRRRPAERGPRPPYPAGRPAAPSLDAERLS